MEIYFKHNKYELFFFNLKKSSIVINKRDVQYTLLKRIQKWIVYTIVLVYFFQRFFIDLFKNRILFKLVCAIFFVYF